MAQILVRNLDNDVVERLKARAKANSRSLQAEVKMILQEASQQVSHVEAWATIERFREEMKRTGRTFSDSTELVREERDR